MLIDLLRLCTEAVTLANFGWHKHFDARQHDVQFGQSAFIGKFRNGYAREPKAPRTISNRINFVKF